MTEEKPPEDRNQNKSIIKKIKQKIISLFENWWKNQAVVTGRNKMDFYYKHKKIFKYESYLDNLSRNKRVDITRFRLSSHFLPIEALRYKKIIREERKCMICNLNELGDEQHYLLKCNNAKIENTREIYIKEIKRIILQTNNFSTENIITYCINMNDHNIQLPTATFIHNILKIYKEESK